jgi:delta24(24(1))-sterol reductase
MSRKFTPEKDVWKGKYEFGGPLGCIGVMLYSHFVMYYFWLCIEFYQGELIYPGHRLILNDSSFSSEILGKLWTHASLEWSSFLIVSLFYFLEYLLAVVMPGPVTEGLPIPSENGFRFRYRCNAIWAWLVILIGVGSLHFSGVYPLWIVREQFGHFMTAAVVWGDLVSVICYVSGLRRAIRCSGNLIYDFFMGSSLNPRLPFDIDLKMFAEIRNSWVILFLLTSSCAAKMYKDHGVVTGNMWFMVLAHFLYTHACQKGEECIPTTWDMYYEKFGWMLIYWNTAGVPFLYCVQSMYVQTILGPQQHHWVLLGPMFVVLIAAYYVWDTANAQKNRFRMQRSGVDLAIIQRKTFPQLPWGYIPQPRTIKSENGELFVDGWYRYGRKLHYTADMIMASLWGMSCGFRNFIPYFYICFFVVMLTHRERRDHERCSAKYGDLWNKYLKLVPYKFVPGVI